MRETDHYGIGGDGGRGRTGIGQFVEYIKLLLLQKESQCLSQNHRIRRAFTQCFTSCCYGTISPSCHVKIKIFHKVSQTE